MKKSLTRFLLPILAALIAFVLIAVFLAGLRREEPTVVAKRYIEAGTLVTADTVDTLFEVKLVHPSALLPGAIDDLQLLVDQTLQVPRLPGDQVTTDMVGSTGASSIAAGLLPDHRAIAIDVSRATGALGVIRRGDLVDVIATVDLAGVAGRGGAAVSAVVIRGARVLVVPQTFRYTEAPVTSEDEEAMLPGGSTSSTSQTAQRNTILLDVPLSEVELTAGYTDTLTGEWVDPVMVSPVALLALFNENATLHLVVRPVNATDVAVPPVDLQKLLDALLPATPEEGR